MLRPNQQLSIADTQALAIIKKLNTITDREVEERLKQCEWFVPIIKAKSGLH